ncbi:MAG: helix-hairpin-helix domain-containing protein [Pseudomonadota bacterium]
MIHDSRKKSALGLVVIAVVFTFVIFPCLIGSNDVGFLPKESALSNSGDCGYRVIKKERIVGTVFVDEQAKISTILQHVGESHRYYNEFTKVFPCGSVIDITDGNVSLVGKLSGAQILACGKRINLNEASETDLASVPGLGKSLASKIVDYRNSIGSFQSPLEISRVKGIGPLKAQKFLHYFK